MSELHRDKISGHTVAELFDAKPACMRVFMRYGMGCIGCPMARFETVAEAAQAYQLDVETFVGELQAAPANPPVDEADLCRWVGRNPWCGDDAGPADDGP